MQIPFAEWAPDSAALNSNVAADVRGVLCAANSYIPFPSLVSVSEPLPDKPLGYFTARSLDGGEVVIFAATSEKIYRMDNTDFSWNDVSQNGTTYAASDDALWSFAQFGDYVVAVNKNDDPQYFQIGVSTEFADLPGSPPRANQVRVWGDFLALIQLTSNPNRVHWSGLNDITQWTPGANNCDFQDFPDGGIVQGSSEATNPVIILERAIYVATFIPGSVSVFNFTKVHDQRGAASDKSIATRGSYMFYADRGGFFQIGADGSLANIGFEKVDRTIFGSLAAPDAASMRGVIDPFYSRVYWAADMGGVGFFNRLYVYDWNLQRWSQAHVSIHGHFPAASTGTTLEGLDDISASLDDLPFSLDSKVWQGGAPILAAFTMDYRLAFFNGPPMRAVLTTQEVGDTAGQVTFLREVMPVVDTDEVSVEIGSRFRRSDPVNWLQARRPSAATGMVQCRARGRFHRFRVSIDPGSLWTHAQGIDVKPQPMGIR